MISKNHITVPGYRSVVRSTPGKKEIDNKYINYSHRLRDLLSMYSQRIKKKNICISSTDENEGNWYQKF